MRKVLSSLAMPVLHRLNPETAHVMALRALRLGLAPRAPSTDASLFAVRAFGRVFNNPIGLAAGFDKNAIASHALHRLGFGFVETGTVTRHPQSGNPKPRLFRLTEDQAIINRMGFNNVGIDAYVRNLVQRQSRTSPIGANISLNKQNAKPIEDFPTMVGALSGLVDYTVINVSSPNTPGLRHLQASHELMAILQASMPLANGMPILVKIAPDLSDADLAAVIETCVTMGVQGLIISNTTITRPDSLRSPDALEPGGLSGKPLRDRSTALLAKAYQLAQKRLVLIGVGGIFTGQDVLTKIRAGASLVQVYTGFIYHGPTWIPRLKLEFLDALWKAGFGSVTEAIGTAKPADCSET